MSQNLLISQFLEQSLAQNVQSDVLSEEQFKSTLENLHKNGFPTVKHEEWKYSNTKKLLNTPFDFNKDTKHADIQLESLGLPNIGGEVLYFVNGVFVPELSSIKVKEGVKILTTRDARKSQSHLFEHFSAKSDQYKKEAFLALNSLEDCDGYVITIDDNTSFDSPIIIRNIADSRAVSPAMQFRNLIVVGDHTEVKIAETYRDLGENPSFTNVLTEVIMGAEAKVDYYKIQDENDQAFHIGTTNVTQKDKSSFYAATVTINGGFVRNNLNLELNGEYIEDHMFGLYIPNKAQHIDNHTVADHKKPNSVSNELYKGVLMDESTGVFNGKIFVRQEAQKTNAYQNCRNVVLSDKAVMNTKPQLEIWADDVKCSHGATTGQLNDEAIFYMQSRGIPKDEAVKLQLVAFAEDVISQIRMDEIRNYLEVLIHQKLA